jgi:NodT family efflux transporter outer membrane factor (OMF) lipoprotein
VRVVFAIVISATLVSGCVLPQTETPAATALADASLGLDGAAYGVPAEKWWKKLGDAQLDQLIDDALRDSPSLAQVMARLRSAQAQASVANAGKDPHFAIDADETYQRFPENYYFPPPYSGNRYWIGQSLATANWSLDFWGRQAALIRSARAQVGATQLDIDAARLALTGAVTQAYLDLYRSWELLDIATRAREQREELLRLTQQRVSAGIDTQIELQVAKASAAEARAVVMQAESMRDLAVHRVTALAGYGADHYAQIARPHVAMDAAADLPEKLPFDLLGHRADVMAARARIDAARAGRDAARAAFYPDINLRAFVGMQAIGLGELVKAGSLTYGVGPALHLPIFDAKRVRADYTNATAELDSTVASYNSIVLDAVRETADQLTLNAAITSQIAQYQQATDAAEVAYTLARKRYAAGLTTQLTVLNAELQLLNMRRELIGARTNLVVARISLRLMLGGTFGAQQNAASNVASNATS